MTSKKHLEEFYNYKYWRETQRKQISMASNLYFVLSSALIGYSVNLLINTNNCIPLECRVKIFLIIGLGLNILSLIFYICLTDNKLKDYRKTAKLIDTGKKPDEIRSLTKKLGDVTWEYFKYQKLTMIAGFIFCGIAYIFLALN